MQETLIERVDSVISLLLIRFAPVWYATQTIRNMPLPDYAPLNPLSCDARSWFDLAGGLAHTSSTLLDVGGSWQGLAKELEHLAVSRQLQRPISITRLTGSYELGEFKHLSETNTFREAALTFDDITEPDTEEDFDQAMRQLPRGLAARHREWDGRLLLESSDLLPDLMPLIRYAGARQRDAMAPALLTIESIRQEALERIRNKYWWFLMGTDSADALQQLFRQCGLNCAVSGPLPGRPAHAFFFTTKTNQRTNRVILQLMSSKRSSQLTEFGRFLSQHRHRFRTL